MIIERSALLDHTDILDHLSTKEELHVLLSCDERQKYELVLPGLTVPEGHEHLLLRERLCPTVRRIASCVDAIAAMGLQFEGFCPGETL